MKKILSLIAIVSVLIFVSCSKKSSPVEVKPTASVSVTPSSLTFNISDINKTFEIKNIGEGSVRYSVADGVNWLPQVVKKGITEEPEIEMQNQNGVQSNTILSGKTDTVTVHIKDSGSHKNYEGSFVVKFPENTGLNKTVNIFVNN